MFMPESWRKQILEKYESAREGEKVIIKGSPCGWDPETSKKGPARRR
jgi:hypothetical protein